jgi:potassium-transporting ATPase KdpC subunit
MKKNLLTSILMTLATTVLFGLAYPLVVTGLAQLIFPDKANGQLIVKNGSVVGSRIVGQGFSGPGYFHSRPSAAGKGYDAANSAGSNLGPTNQKLLDRVKSDVGAAQADNPNTPVPVDLITTSSSGLDPDISPAAALFQAPRISRVRGISQDQVRTLVQRHIQQRELGILGEPRVNVLGLNLALDEKWVIDFGCGTVLVTRRVCKPIIGGSDGTRTRGLLRDRQAF